jgi:hypothetical protein
MWGIKYTFNDREFLLKHKANRFPDRLGKQRY